MTKDVTDPNNLHDGYRTQRTKLDTDERIEEADRLAIADWLDWLDVEKDRAPSTLRTKASIMRSIASRIDRPLTALESETDVRREVLVPFKNGTFEGMDGGVSSNYLRNIRQQCRQFFDFHGHEWAEEITVGTTETTKVTDEDILDNDETAALFNAARHPRNKALLAVLLATGQRITALSTLRIGDVDPIGNGQSGFITLNSDGVGLKGATGKRPLVWSTPYVQNWLDIHPRREDDDAPLFCAIKAGSHGNLVSYDGRRGSASWKVGDPVSQSTLADHLANIAERAGVDQSKVNPHNFRHTAITRMIRDGLDEQKIKALVGWAKDSSQFKTYSHVTLDETIDDVLDHYGMGGEETPDVGPKIESCPRPACGAPLGGLANPTFCPSCGLALTQPAAQSIEDTQSDVIDDLADPETTDEQREGLAVLADLLDEDPEAMSKLVSLAEAFEGGTDDVDASVLRALADD